ncbi:MAG: stage II sporulation protein M [Eubacteriales bacterium]
MIRKMNFKLSRNLTFLILFIFGVIVGSIFANYLDANQRNELGILNNYFLDKYKNIQLNYIDLFKFVFLDRIKVILFLWFFGLTFFGVPVIIIAFLYFGFNFGFMLSIGTIVYGGKGVVLNLVYLLPHFLVYVPLIIYLMNKSFDICATLYYKKIATNKSYRINNKQVFSEYILVFIISLLICIIGSLLETFVNPGLVQWSIKNLIKI